MAFFRLLAGLLVLAVGVLPGGLRLQVYEGRPTVDGVYVNGHGPYTFLLDTGTNVNLIETRLARTIGMNGIFDVDFMSAVGKTHMPGSDGNEVELGPVKANGQKFLFSELDAVHMRFPKVRGVLGQWFLSGFDYMIDLQGKRLEFGKQNPNGSRARSRVLNGRTAVATSLGDLVLDSGVAQLVLFGVDPDTDARRTMRTMAGSQIVGTVFSRLIIEGRSIWRGDAVAIPRGGEPGVDGLMPLTFFKTIYFCNSEGYVVFD